MGLSSNIVLSVIVPVFNSEQWLPRCLDSILAQTVPVDWELILIDDGSSDKSGEICDRFSRSSSIIHVLHTINQGASLARRAGLDMAQGEFVSFVDSDDYIKPNYLKTLYELLQETGCGISACAIEGRMETSDSLTPRVLPFDELMTRFFKYEFWGLYGKLYRKQLLEDIPFPKATISEDYAVMAKLFFKSPRMAYTPAPLYFYEHHSESLSRLPLSNRSFEEFDNVHDVYLLTAAEKPAFRLNALSNAVETAVKLLWASRKTRATYQDQRKKLKAFLSEHRKDLLACPNLLSKTKVLALLLSL